MTRQAPRIAIPEPTSMDAAYNERSLPQYIHAIEAEGGVAVPIPLNATMAMQQSLLASCAGILLPGSPADVDPSLYGQQRVEECGAKDAAREAADSLLLAHAFAHAKPFLGICYGLQSLNVWRGGSLTQHLPPGAAVNHQPGRHIQNAHQVTVAPNSLLAQSLGDTAMELPVNSSHHQAVSSPGEMLRVVATSPVDGVIEAVEGVEPGRFLLGVQWHPERTYDSSAVSRALFAAFLDAARSWDQTGAD